MNSDSRKKKQKFPKGSLDHKHERRRYLSQLVHELNNTNSREAKLQVLANLANFAYDPYNYTILRELNVVKLFLYQVEFGKIDKLIAYALSGLCSLSFDDHLKQDIVRGRGIELLQQKLSTSTLSVSMISSALAILMSLVTDSTRQVIITQVLEAKLRTLAEHDDKRVQNLANIFLEDFFPTNEIVPPPTKKLKI